MTRKPYTMREMKQIVDYLTEHKAYADVRGRKLWIDLASSKIIDRTWQSMKETFMKRILPDIHNPYYKLTVEQISSFRQEYDILARNQNKLEVYTVTDSSSTETQISKKKTAKQKKEEEGKSGEDKCSKIQPSTRSSTDTLVLENCYETAEDVRRELESPDVIERNEPTTKSLRDFITYSDPLTPMLQEVVDDFATDEDEPQLQIVEDEPVPGIEQVTRDKSPSPFRKSQSFTKISEKSVNANEPSKIKSLKLKKTRKGTWANKDTENAISPSKDKDKNQSGSVLTTDNNTLNTKDKSTLDKNENSISVILSNDTPLPNNQEELTSKNKKRSSTESQTSDLLEAKEKKTKGNSRKRSASQSSNAHKKKKNSKGRDPSEIREQEKDSETFNSHPHAVGKEKDHKPTKDNLDDGPNEKSKALRNEEESPDKLIVESSDSVTDVTIENIKLGNSQEAGPSGVNSLVDISADNPCLKSVNLFTEQCSRTKYSSESEENGNHNIQVNQETSNDKNETVNTPKLNFVSNEPITEVAVNDNTNKANKSDNTGVTEIFMVKSHSESESDKKIRIKKKNSIIQINKSREKVLANVFGFASGSQRRTANHKPQYKTMRNKVSSNNMSKQVEEGSSDEYSSESDISGRSKGAGYTHRYMKPQSHDILEHPDGKGIFVIGRKKVYPLILKKNSSLYYACKGENLDEEVNDSFWKEKYLEQKKKCAEETMRAEELAWLLKNEKEEKRKNVTSPILPANKSLSTTLPNQQAKETVVMETPRPKVEETVRIKFTKHHEIELEGQWPHVNPVFEKMVEIFKKNEAESLNAKKATETNAQEKQPEIVSSERPEVQTRKTSESSIGNGIYIQTSSENGGTNNNKPPNRDSTDPDVHEKVNKIESEIFKQIEEIDKSDQSINVSHIAQDLAGSVNITKRKRGRPKNSPSSGSNISLESEKKKPREPRKQKSKPSLTEAESDATSVSSKRKPRAPRKYESDSGIIVKPKTKISKSAPSLKKPEIAVPEDDSVRYMFPPPTKAGRSYKKEDKFDNSFSADEQEIFRSDNYWRNSESTQGYQDSDVSPPNKIVRKKKRSSAINLLRKTKRRSSPYLADDDTNEAADTIRPKINTGLNSSLSSEVYRSESYQLLLPKQKLLCQLDRIDENPLQNGKVATLTRNTNNEYISELINNSYRHRSSDGNSSNMSLPLSPELSVVENLSLVRDLISSSIEDHPTINETQKNEVNDILPCKKYLISDVDVSLPLMEQDCELLSDRIVKTGPRTRKSTITDSLQARTINMEEPSPSESLDQKLRDMLLESARKMSQVQTKASDKETVMEVDPSESSVKKARGKRCSTPRKKKTAQKSKTLKIDPVIEEHTESCSRGGRKSCPPVINIVPCEENITNTPQIVKKTIGTEAVLGRKKKDVIKVKVIKPKNKRCSKERVKSSSRLSVCTDSGINDTGSCVSDQDCKCCVSTELIHNHSDTCLHVDECIADSVEFLDNSTKSIISLNSNSDFETSCMVSGERGSLEELVASEFICANAQDATSLINAEKPAQQADSDPATDYHTPANGSLNSLLTEDLSNETPPKTQHATSSNWYLFSEDDTNSNSVNVRSNLHQIFSLTCAVPNLSTISENSKDNDSTKITLKTESKEEVQSQSIFDLDF